jgi:uncharacterized protein with HEPN domain
MPHHDIDVRLRHMLDAAREAAQMAQGKARADLDTDRPLNLSLVRLLEIVGEAASRIPPGERGQYSGIPWMPRLRQCRLRHSLGNRLPRSTAADC